MKTTHSTNTFSLVEAATKRIPDPAGLEITCTSGSIWITLDSILHNVILTAGTADDTFVTRSHRSALIFALSDAQILIAAPAVTATLAPRTRTEWQYDQPMLPIIQA